MNFNKNTIETNISTIFRAALVAAASKASNYSIISYIQVIFFFFYMRNGFNVSVAYQTFFVQLSKAMKQKSCTSVHEKVIRWPFWMKKKKKNNAQVLLSYSLDCNTLAHTLVSRNLTHKIEKLSNHQKAPQICQSKNCVILTVRVFQHAKFKWILMVEKEKSILSSKRIRKS